MHQEERPRPAKLPARPLSFICPPIQNADTASTADRDRSRSGRSGLDWTSTDVCSAGVPLSSRSVAKCGEKEGDVAIVSDHGTFPMFPGMAGIRQLGRRVYHDVLHAKDRPVGACYYMFTCSWLVLTAGTCPPPNRGSERRSQPYFCGPACKRAS